MPVYQGQKVCLVTVDMGYGHERAAYPLRYLDRQGEMIIANNYAGMPESDLKIWNQGRKPYEFFSRAKHLPLVGKGLFAIMDSMQQIKDFYPRRNLHHQSLQLKSNIYMIRKKRWGKHLIDKLDGENLPLLTPFFTIAYMAEEFNFRHDIYLVVCDADVSRAWAAPNPMKSKIKYLVPNRRVYERLQLYGVKPANIYFTGFPLPRENTGEDDLDILRSDLAGRIINLDPKQKFIEKYKHTINRQLGSFKLPVKPDHPLTISFAVGGAGAQREYGANLLKSLAPNLERGDLKLILIAGVHQKIRDYFAAQVAKLGLSDIMGRHIVILYESSREKYFGEFNRTMRVTDILWTKPSELSFYVGLGLPLIITEPLGSQEEFNRKWLIGIGAGLDQEKTKYANEWLFDWLNSGWLAEAAMQGYLEAPKYGTFNIEKVINGEVEKVKEPDSVLQY